MQGFGRAIVEAALNNARDSEQIARMNIEGTLRTTVTNIITAYLNVVSAEQTIKNDEESLQRAIKSVEQTKLFIKAGRKAGNELVTVKANVASAQSTLENDKNSLLQQRYALLSAIGLDPNTKVRFTSLALDNLFGKYHFPPVSETVHLSLRNDISYQASIITLEGATTRAVMTAKDNARWQLNFALNAATGNGTGGGQSAGINSLFNGANQAQSASLALTIPINDQNLKQAILSAKVALQQAKLALQQEKWSIETTAINNWNSVKSAERAKRFAEEAEMLQEKTYQISYQKYLHGLIDSLELQTAQVQLIQAQQTMLTAQITYLQSLVNLDNLVGNTLRTWKVNVRLK
jgi:outer membrane protein